MQETQQTPAFDLVILGASGFTGKYVLREALKHLSGPTNPSSPLKALAIAGRDPVKLTEALIWAGSRPNTIPILITDTSDPDSLIRVCSQTRLLISCVGPFRLHGEHVVSACVEAGCDYVDVCGEPEFMERAEALYHDKAAGRGSLVISACGFDSVPAELGFAFNSRQWKAAEAPNSIVAYIAAESSRRIVANYGTYKSAVLSVGNMDKLMELRSARPKRARPLIVGPRPPKGPKIEHQKELGLWAVMLPSSDPIVVRRTLATLTENPKGLPGANETPDQTAKREAFWSGVKPAHFGLKLCSKSKCEIHKFITIGRSIKYLCTSKIGRWLLLEFPSIFGLGYFRKGGATEDEVECASFKMWFVGRGYQDGSRAKGEPDLEIVTRITGPEMGYKTSSISLVQCALILLGQRRSLPKGGVFTPGIVFGSTDLQQRLVENGISFDIVSRKKL